MDGTDTPHGYATKLPEAALRYLNVRSLVEIAMLALVALAVVLWLVPESWRLPAAIAVALLAGLGIVVDLPIVNRLIVRHTSYEITPDAVRISRGVLVHRDLVISTAQILNVLIVSGPILRRYGLAKVSFATIAHADPLGPVTAAEAEAIRREVLAVFGETPVTA